MKTDYCAAREGNAQSRNTFHLCEQRLNGGRNSQKALHVPLPRQWDRLLWGEGGGGRVISGRLANRLGSPFGTSGGVNWPYVYAAVFDEFSLREGYRNNALPR